ncbi:hypothetical protein EDD18DRAFT_1112430 [Armillaria luteobubalina]|uniref:Uncharacterized protein n=1 Tax=Armillaria luteobubalina TaxID=153913 RepID=A0AA39PES3_9AGAR|nr:hypothetical protein EDD18DRAFT_1112430 [Armillaria luteobubalina]
MYLPSTLEAALLFAPAIVSFSYNYPTMKIRIFTTHATETAFFLYREAETKDLHMVLEHTKSDIRRVISEDVIAKKFTLNLDCIVLNLVVENAPQNICAIFMQCRFLGVLRYSQSTGPAEFVHHHSVDRMVYWGPWETIIVDAVPDVEIQHVGDWYMYSLVHGLKDNKYLQDLVRKLNLTMVHSCT